MIVEGAPHRPALVGARDPDRAPAQDARYWFVAPLDGFEVEPGAEAVAVLRRPHAEVRVNADDTTRYQIGRMAQADWRRVLVFLGTGGRTCRADVPGAGRDGYVVRFDLHRVRRMPPTFVHLARDGDGTTRRSGRDARDSDGRH
jgi:hypothetical protein